MENTRMKIWVILCLAAGPLAVRAQHMARPNSSGWLDTASLGWHGPAMELPNSARLRYAGGWGRPVFPNNLHLPRRDDDSPMTLYVRDSLRILLPDHMACLIAAGADHMPVDRRKGRDPMPGLKKP